MTAISANFSGFPLLLTLRRPRSGSLEGWATVAIARSGGFPTAVRSPPFETRALGALLRVRRKMKG